jgi:hypothetical protein
LHKIAVLAELLVEPIDLTEPAVVRHDAAGHGERVSILHRTAARCRPADMGYERL